MANTLSGVRRSTIPVSIKADLFNEFWQVAEYWQQRGESLSAKICEAFIEVGRKEQDDIQEHSEPSVLYCGNCALELAADEDSDDCSNCKRLAIQKQKLEAERDVKREQLRQEAALKEQKMKTIAELNEIIQSSDEERRKSATKLLFELCYGRLELDNPELTSFLSTKEGSTPADSDLLPDGYSTQQGEEPLTKEVESN
jgi:hypothetical protein